MYLLFLYPPKIFSITGFKQFDFDVPLWVELIEDMWVYPSDYSIRCPVSYKIFHCSWNMHIVKTCVNSGNYSLHAFQVVPSPNSRNFLTCVCWSLSTWRLGQGGTLCELALWVALSPLVFCPASYSHPRLRKTIRLC